MVEHDLIYNSSQLFLGFKVLMEIARSGGFGPCGDIELLLNTKNVSEIVVYVTDGKEIRMEGTVLH